MLLHFWKYLLYLVVSWAISWSIGPSKSKFIHPLKDSVALVELQIVHYQKDLVKWILLPHGVQENFELSLIDRPFEYHHMLHSLLYGYGCKNSLGMFFQLWVVDATVVVFLGPVQLWYRSLCHHALVQIDQTKALYMSRLQIILHIDGLQHCIR